MKTILFLISFWAFHAFASGYVDFQTSGLTFRAEGRPKVLDGSKTIAEFKTYSTEDANNLLTKLALITKLAPTSNLEVKLRNRMSEDYIDIYDGASLVTTIRMRAESTNTTGTLMNGINAVIEAAKKKGPQSDCKCGQTTSGQSKSQTTSKDGVRVNQ
jgi:hypothetical protein